MLVIGTRPEAIKLAPVAKGLRARSLPAIIVTTGQHPDLLPPTLASLGISADIELPLGEGSGMVAALQDVIRTHGPACIIVQGDTRSALAGALAGFLEDVPVAHVEAGLRTHEISDPFPEELFRVGIARLADHHLAPTEDAGRNLLAESVPPASISVVGNTVIDALFGSAGSVKEDTAGMDGRQRVIVTVHRQENGPNRLGSILGAAGRLADEARREVIFIRHPRLRETALPGEGEAEKPEVQRISVRAPLPYDEFIDLLRSSHLVITDSGGVQEEAAALGKRLIVVRDQTERPEALQKGERLLVGTNEEAIFAAGQRLLAGSKIGTPSTALGDGRSGERIAAIIGTKYFSAY